jgi:hypothetical protein
MSKAIEIIQIDHIYINASALVRYISQMRHAMRITYFASPWNEEKVSVGRRGSIWEIKVLVVKNNPKNKGI